MKKRLTRGEKWLFASPLLFLVVAGLLWRPQPIVSDALELPHSEGVATMEFSPDSKQLMTFSREAVGPVPLGRVYDVDSVSIVSVLDTPASSANPLALQLGANRYNWPVWSKDGTRISANTFRPNNNLNRIAIWDANSGKVTADYRYPSANYQYPPAIKTTIRGPLHFSSDDRTLIGERKSTPVFDVASGKVLKQTDLSVDEKWRARENEKLGLLVVHENGMERLQVIDSKTKRVVWKPPIEHPMNYRWYGDVLCIQDIRAKYSGQQNSGPLPEELRLILWDSKTRQMLPSPPMVEDATLITIAFNPDKKSLVYYSGKGTQSWLGKGFTGELTMWDYRANRVLWRHTNSDKAGSLEWSPNGKWLLMLVDQLPFTPSQVYDKNGNLIFKDKRTSFFTRFSPDSKKLASCVGEADSSGSGIPLSSRIEIHRFAD